MAKPLGKCLFTVLVCVLYKLGDQDKELYHALAAPLMHGIFVHLFTLGLVGQELWSKEPGQEQGWFYHVFQAQCQNQNRGERLGPPVSARIRGARAKNQRKHTKTHAI
jgi:hypothetical protein